jgi:hypothetical protein
MLTFHRVSRKKLWIKPSAQGLHPLQIDHCVFKYKSNLTRKLPSSNWRSVFPYGIMEFPDH